MKNDLNLNDELNDLLFTDIDTDAISRPVLWTAYRRSVEGKKINCSACNPDDTGYVEGQLGCPYCGGKGYMWDQKLINGYLYKQNEGKDRYNMNMFSDAGKADVTSFVLITPFDKSPLIEDTIDILGLDTNNRIQIPMYFESSLKVIYGRGVKASTKQADFHVAFLGG